MKEEKIIHIYTQYYSPVSNACSNRIEKYVMALKDNYSIKIITWMPNYPTWVKLSRYKWKILKKEVWEHSEEIVRTYEFATKNEWSIWRLLNYLSFMLSSFFYGLFTKKPDIIIVTSPPLFTALGILLLNKVRRIPYILEIRDLWPDSVVALWFMKKNSFSYKIFSWLELKLYKNSIQIIWVTKWICKSIEEKWIEKNKIFLQYNVFNNNKVLKYNSKELNEITAKHNINTNKKVFLYAWNHSSAQNLYNIINFAKDYKDWNFYFIWEWESKKELETYVSLNNINNVFFLWQKTKEEVYKFISIADFCLASLDNKEVFNDAVPTKILEYLAFNRQVICFIKWDLADKIKESNSGLVYDKYNNKIINDLNSFSYKENSWKNLIESYFSYNSFDKNINKLLLENINNIWKK